jgi:alanyl-tRNA synthetase
VNSLLSTRLYWHDAYLRSFEAAVSDLTTVNGQPAAALTASAFYPTGGGQPHDTGLLNGVTVTEVLADDDKVWHLLDARVPPGLVHGQIAWPRRYDHMQQHTGQHILSQAFIATRGAETVGFHLGKHSATIDLNQAAISQADLDAAETLANQIIAENRLVRGRFVSPEELLTLPLRRPPKVQTDIRVVEIAGFDWCACGGTHVRQTAEVGQIKIQRLDHRGAETRVEFLCGQRAQADYRRKQGTVQALINRLDTAEDDLPAAVDRLQDKLRTAQRQLREAQADLAAAEAARLWNAGRAAGERRVVHAYLDNRTPETVKAIASALRAQPGCVAVLACELSAESGGQLFCAAAGDAALDMGPIMAAATAAGARGGGRGAWAQGGAPNGALLRQAFDAAVAALADSIRHV